jgi:hypothetical protein
VDVPVASVRVSEARPYAYVVAAPVSFEIVTLTGRSSRSYCVVIVTPPAVAVSRFPLSSYVNEVVPSSVARAVTRPAPS